MFSWLKLKLGKAGDVKKLVYFLSLIFKILHMGDTYSFGVCGW